MPYLVVEEQKSLRDTRPLGEVHAGPMVSPLLPAAGATVPELVSVALGAADMHSEVALRN